MTLRLGLGVVLPDVLNVKDFGAKGIGTDDTAAIQAAIDSAFGTAASPHGTNATLNKSLFFPNGTYGLSSPLVLTQVRGVRIYGAGQESSIMISSAGAVTTNGLEYCAFENLSFRSSGGTGAACFELDWNGSGSVGLNGNVFTNCSFGNSGPVDHCVRIGLSGHGGTNNQFYSCFIAGGTVTGLTTWSASATGNCVFGGGIASCGTGVWIKLGQVSSICDSGFSGNGQDILMDSDGPILMKGNRTETALGCVFNSPTSVAVLEGHAGAQPSGDFCRTKGKVIIDSSSAGASGVLCSNASYTGTVYVRGCYFPNASFFTAFAGTVAQNI